MNKEIQITSPFLPTGDICHCRAENACKITDKRETCYMFIRMQKQRKKKIKEIYKHDLFKNIN